jgi:hypothetical protein
MLTLRRFKRLLMNTGKDDELEGKFNPHSLTDERKELGVTACEDLIQTWQTNPHFLNYIAARDESWVFQCDPETKRRSMNRKTKLFPRPRNYRWQWSRIGRTTIVS